MLQKKTFKSTKPIIIEKLQTIINKQPKIFIYKFLNLFLKIIIKFSIAI